MLRTSQIMQLIHGQWHANLVDRVLANGRCRSRAFRDLLRQPACVEVAARGLGLQRIAELTYGPSPQADELVCGLLREQAADGLFGSPTCSLADSPGALGDGNQARVAASAVVARGLHAWLQQVRAPGRADARARMIEVVIDRTIGRLAEELTRAVRHGERASLILVALLLWQLGDLPAFRNRAPVAEALAWLVESAPGLIEDELAHYAQAVAA